ncbi:MAG: glutathione peroxidase [Flavobacteriales bacterium]|nr:glutathione peroxidase [Flavobacteriales bacterium]
MNQRLLVKIPALIVMSLTLMAMTHLPWGNHTTDQSMSIHQFKVNTLEGDEFDMSSLSGKKVLIVNTASECGLTPQYEQLQELYEAQGGEKFEIIGFPSNDFAGQEPGSAEDIRAFCQKNYGVSFPMMEKVHVKGDGQHPLYSFLTSKDQNGVGDFEVQWNFHKFLIDEEGKLEKDVSPQTLPIDESILNWIKD